MSQSTTPNTDIPSRRRFLMRSSFGAAALLNSTGARVAAGVASSVASTAVHSAREQNPELPASLAALDDKAPRRLDLYSAHTKEELSVVYFTHGMYIDENIQALNHLMRDRRANVATSMDIKLYDQLFLVQRKFEGAGPLQVLSGYRTPETNAKLRRRSNGVAKNSLHIEGRAVDFYLPGVPVKTLRSAAVDLDAGGVGIYSRSGFIHIDTGAIRRWGK
ncbi:MAG: DUF882 domain-containing protein [Granulosicoccus sp.]